MDFTELIFEKITQNEKNINLVKRYIKFIDKFSLDEKVKGKTHNHHILPKCIFPKYKNLNRYPLNKSILTYRAHYIAHYILGRIFGKEMWISFSRMSKCKTKNSILYNIGVCKHSENICGSGNPMYGRKHTEKTKEKMAKSQLGISYEEKFGKEKANEMKSTLSKQKTGMKYSEEVNKRKGRSGEENSMYGRKIEKENHPMYGKNHSEETKAKMSKAKEGYVPWMKGKHHTDETKKKLSEARKGVSSPNKGKKAKTIKCEYCGKEINAGNYTRWHGDNCKHKAT